MTTNLPSTLMSHLTVDTIVLVVAILGAIILIASSLKTRLILWETFRHPIQESRIQFGPSWAKVEDREKS